MLSVHQIIETCYTGRHQVHALNEIVNNIHLQKQTSNNTNVLDLCLSNMMLFTWEFISYGVTKPPSYENTEQKNTFSTVGF